MTELFFCCPLSKPMSPQNALNILPTASVLARFTAFGFSTSEFVLPLGVPATARPQRSGSAPFTADKLVETGNQLPVTVRPQSRAPYACLPPGNVTHILVESVCSMAQTPSTRMFNFPSRPVAGE